MGLAASQARYLSLTARKTNVEYEGQQVNQQRTALANQSAGLFNQMLALKVPTPPAQSDYSKTYYTYTDPATSETCTIENIIIDTQRSTGNTTYADIRVTKKSADFTVEPLTIGAGDLLWDTYSKTENSETKNYFKVGGANRQISGPFTNTELSNKINAMNDNEAIDANNQKYFEITIGNIVYCVPAANATETQEEFMARYNNAKTSGTGLQAYATENYTKTEAISEKVIIDKANDGTGRWTGMTVVGGKNDGKSYTLTQQTVQDKDAYDAAMETYVAEKAIYEKTVEEINAQTLVIQQQDKTLELHLDQLDTEQQAIQTELDAVKKVIDKNIEETFKTFA